MRECRERGRRERKNLSGGRLSCWSLEKEGGAKQVVRMSEDPQKNDDDGWSFVGWEKETWTWTRS